MLLLSAASPAERVLFLAPYSVHLFNRRGHHDQVNHADGSRKIESPFQLSEARRLPRPTGDEEQKGALLGPLGGYIVTMSRVRGRCRECRVL